MKRDSAVLEPELEFANEPPTGGEVVPPKPTTLKSAVKGGRSRVSASSPKKGRKRSSGPAVKDDKTPDRGVVVVPVAALVAPLKKSKGKTETKGAAIKVPGGLGLGDIKDPAPGAGPGDKNVDPPDRCAPRTPKKVKRATESSPPK